MAAAFSARLTKYAERQAGRFDLHDGINQCLRLHAGMQYSVRHSVMATFRDER